MKETIIIATANEDKMREIREIFATPDREILSMREAGYDLEIEENGTTFTENAIIKAREVCLASGQVAMADDSGLVIDALQGMPGIYSARYLGHDTPYSEKNAHILSELADLSDSERSARYVCAVACVFPDGHVLSCEETCEGRIAYTPAGSGGFGYDPIFYLPDLGCTAAELSAEEKHAISHRGKAIRRMEKMLSER